MVALAALVFAFAGCGEDRARDETLRWECPVGWVGHESGGCGPAVLLCGAGGGAVEGACDAPVSGPFLLEPDGAIGGGWPAEDFAPPTGMDTCPDGWRAVGDGTCDPALPADCGAESHAVPGGRCTPTGVDTCGAAEFADVGAESAGARVVHVRLGADPVGADGSAARPYDTFAAAQTAAGSNGWILLAPGTYTERIRADRSIHVVGRCPRDVILAGAVATSDRPSVLFAGAGTAPELRGVTLSGEYYGVVAARGARPTLRNVRIARATEYGAVALDAGTELRIEDSAIVEMQNGGSPSGLGALAQEGGTITLARVAIEDAIDRAVTAAVGARVVLEDVAIRRVSLSVLGQNGMGLRISNDATASLTRTVIEDARQAAIRIEPGTTLEAHAVVVRRVGPDRKGTGGGGLLVLEGAEALVDGALFEDTRSYAIAATGAGATIDLRRAVIRRVAATSDGAAGWGLAADQAASIVVERVRIEGAHEFGAATGNGGTLAIRQSVVEGTEPRASDDDAGFGAYASTGGTIEIADSVLAHNRLAAAFAHGAGAVISIDGSVMRDTTPPPIHGRGGIGVAAIGGGVLDVARTQILRSTTNGIYASTGANVRAADVRVHGVVPDTRGAFGRAISMASGATLELRRSVIGEAFELGVHVHGSGTTATLEDVIVANVEVHPTSGLGVGIGAYSGGRIDATRVAIGRAASGGLFSVPAVEAEATAGSAFGATDVFVGGVRSGTIQVDLSRIEEVGVVGIGRPVAYGLHVGPDCTLAITRAVVLQGGHGFFASGTFSAAQLVVAGQLDAAGAYTPDAPPPEIVDYWFSGNARDEILEDASLPAASDLPPPTDISVE